MSAGGATRFALLLAGLLVAFYGGWIVLWVWHPAAYYDLLQLWGVLPVIGHEPAYARNPLPFFDLEGVISWSECARRGFDVYVVNPCDPAPFHRVANYSPLLVDLPLEWIGTRHTLIAGLAMNALFLASLPFVLAPRSWGEFAVAGAASISAAVLYAVERANIDVFVFFLLAVAILIGSRSLRTRMWLYGAALAGTLIKFYPVVLFATTLREKPSAFIRLVLLFALPLIVFCFAYWPELARISANLPYYHPFSDMFGAAALPLSSARAYGLPPVAAKLMLAALLAAGIYGAVLLAGRIEATLPPIDWQSTRFLFFACGAILAVACFVFQTNNSYRAIFLLMALPGLFALRRAAGRDRLGHIFVIAGIALMICLWSESFRRNEVRFLTVAFGHAPMGWLEQAPTMAFIFAREVCWWLLMTVLAAGIVCFVRQTAVAKAIAGRLAHS